MATVVQRAHNALLLKALLARAMRSLSVPLADLKTAVEYSQSEMEDQAQSMLVPPLEFIKTLEKFIITLEKSSGKEFKDGNPSFEPKKQTSKQLAKKVSKSLRSISKWAEGARKLLKPLDFQIAKELFAIRDQAYEKALSFDDYMIPEHSENDLDARLLKEYKKLAGLECINN